MKRDMDDGSKLRSDSTLYRNRKHLLDSNSKLQTDRKCLGRKKLSRKLQKLITWSYQQKLHPLVDPSPTSDLHSLHLRNLLTFTDYHSFTHDGNSFYRILGIHHLHWLTKNPVEWEKMLRVLEGERFDIHMLTNVPPDFMPYFKKSKVIELFKALAEGFRKKMQAEKDLMKVIGPMLNTYTVFDFAIVAVYRLYTYFQGLLELESEMEKLLGGEERFEILVYGTEVTQIITKIIAECFKVKLNVYELGSNMVDFEFVSYSSMATPIFELSLLKKGKSLSLLEQKLEKEFARIEEKGDQGSGKESIIIAETKQAPTMRSSREISRAVQLTVHPIERKQPIEKPIMKQPPREPRQARQPTRQQPPVRTKQQHLLQNQRFSQVRAQEEQLFEEIFNSMSEKERKHIVLQHLRRKFEAKYQQVKLAMEKDLRRKVDSEKPFSSFYSNRPL